MHEPILITRREFTRMFGITPSEDVIGMVFTNRDGTEVVSEFIFIDDAKPRFSARDVRDIQELERMFNL